MYGVLDLEFHNFMLLKGVRLAGMNFLACSPTSKEFVFRIKSVIRGIKTIGARRTRVPHMCELDSWYNPVKSVRRYHQQ